MKITPLADRVLLKTEKTEAKTASGIIIPDSAQEKTQIASVIAIGNDKEKITRVVENILLFYQLKPIQDTVQIYLTYSTHT